jgi:hypothetical protein
MVNMSPIFTLPMGQERFTSLAEYVEAKGLKKNRVAVELGVPPQRFSALLNPVVYRPRVDDDLARRIARLLNQPFSYVREIYQEAA